MFGCNRQRVEADAKIVRSEDHDFRRWHRPRQHQGHARQVRIKDFTTNPTLMRKAGVADYEAFAQEVLRAVPDRPVSFEVVADEFDEMEARAMEINSWGPNVNVKIPVSNTKRQFAGPLIRRLSEAGVQLNITAVLRLDQVRAIAEHLAGKPPAIVSVLAGRIADIGTDPVPVMRQTLTVLKARPKAELL